MLFKCESGFSVSRQEPSQELFLRPLRQGVELGEVLLVFLQLAEVGQVKVKKNSMKIFRFKASVNTLFDKSLGQKKKLFTTTPV